LVLPNELDDVMKELKSEDEGPVARVVDIVSKAGGKVLVSGIEGKNETLPDLFSESSSFMKVLPKIRELTYEFKVVENTYDPILSIQNELTHKEMEILKLAVNKGFFDTPKRVGLEELAEELGVSKSAIMQILRKAMAKIAKKTVFD
ncbi:hypothetical protein DJ526_08385, partial [Sulfolobus sp. A20-N-G8]